MRFDAFQLFSLYAEATDPQMDEVIPKAMNEQMSPIEWNSSLVRVLF